MQFCFNRLKDLLINTVIKKCRELKLNIFLHVYIIYFFKHELPVTFS